MVHLTAEYWPYVRTGGLGEAVRGLAEYQARAQVPVSVILPLHRAVREGEVTLEPLGEPFTVSVGSTEESVQLYAAAGRQADPRVYFVEHRSFDRLAVYGEGADYSDNHWRFACFCRAALASIPRIAPDTAIVHAHDWHTAIAMAYLRYVHGGDPQYDRIGAVQTVHNPAFQGHFPFEALDDVGLPPHLYDWRLFEWYGHVNFLKGGLAFSDMATTVSPSHAAELRTSLGGFGLHAHIAAMGSRFVGIRNGIDVTRWNPETDPDIPARFTRTDLGPKAVCKRAVQCHFGLSTEQETPLIAMSARLAKQKGFDLLLDAPVFDGIDAQLVVLGRGDASYEEALARWAAAAPRRRAVPLEFSERLEHLVIAGADMLLMPSQFEPCGLTQMRSQVYGALPIVRRVGGLADTVRDDETGFVFDAYNSTALHLTLQHAVDTYRSPDVWTRMVDLAMRQDFSWTAPEQRYRRVYQQALALRAGV